MIDAFGDSDLVLWTAGEQILHSQVVPRGAPPRVLGLALRQAFAQVPWRPKGLRVSSPEELASVRAVAGSLPVEVGETPEVDDAAESFADFVRERTTPGYEPLSLAEDHPDERRGCTGARRGACSPTTRRWCWSTRPRWGSAARAHR